MSLLHAIDDDLVLKWLESLGVPHYLCGQCHGIHITQIQELDGVLESRLFLDQGCMIFTTELEIQAPAVLALQAELTRINGMYAHIKAFLEISEEGLFRLILCDTLWYVAGLAPGQLEAFLQAAGDAKAEIIRDLREANYLLTENGALDDSPRLAESLH